MTKAQMFQIAETTRESYLAQPEHDDWPRSHKIVVGILGITAWGMLVWLALERMG